VTDLATSPKAKRSKRAPAPLSPEWVQRVELLSILLVSAGIVIFLRLARYVGLGEVDELDRRILLALRDSADPSDPIGPLWLEELMRDFTALGGFGALTFLTAATVGGLALAKKGRTALTTLGAIVGGLALGLVLKALFDRARPDLVPHGSYVSTSSFPSGHSMLSAVTYLTLGAVLARVQTTRLLKIYVITLAALLTFLIGASRVYLGVHWPSDVLAGWSAGVVWSLSVWLVTRRFQREGTIEPEPPQED
jgi:undecaprenyl-diphosphatase